VLYTCQWDMLHAEGERLRQRLLGLGKNVQGGTIERVAHGWDKGPYPFHEDPKAKESYQKACEEIRRVFEL